MTKFLARLEGIALVFFLICLTNFPSYAQVKIGGKGGFNISNIAGGNASPDNRFRTGIHLGGYLQYKFNDKIGIQGELLFSQKGTITRPNHDPATYVRINYLDLPFLFTYEFVDGLTGQAGLQFSTPVGAYRRKDGHAKENFLDNIYKTVFSLPIGINYELANGLNFGARSEFGLTPIGGDAAKNYVFLFSIGYSFYKEGSSGRK